MKPVCWFTPPPPAQATGQVSRQREVAHFSGQVVPHLADAMGLRVLCPDPKPGEAMRADALWGLDLQSIADLTPRMLNASALCIYNLADDPGSCGQILEVALRHPGLVVLHDRSLHALCQRMGENGPDENGQEASAFYLSALARWYGRAGQDAGQAVLAGDMPAAELAQAMPLFEIALEGALGAVTHDVPLAEAIRARFPGLPVAVFALPEEGGGDMAGADYAQALRQWLVQEHQAMVERWAKASLIEAAARAYAEVTPLRFVPMLPARLLT